METVRQEQEQGQGNQIQITLAGELADPDVQQSLVRLIRKLPRIADALDAVEQSVDLVSAIARDKETMRQLAERAERAVDRLSLHEESLDALVTLLEKLPKLVHMVSRLEQLYDLGEAVMTDKESLVYLKDRAKDLAAPVTQPLSEGIAVIKEAKERADQTKQCISVFGLMKLLGDPIIQDGLRFIQSLLDVLTERKATRSFR